MRVGASQVQLSARSAEGVGTLPRRIPRTTIGPSQGRNGDAVEMGQNHKGTEERLPLRWLVILSVATAVGIAVGLFGGVVAGVPAGLAATALLHAAVT
jgi:hypothetical protein